RPPGRLHAWDRQRNRQHRRRGHSRPSTVLSHGRLVRTASATSRPHDPSAALLAFFTTLVRGACLPCPSASRLEGGSRTEYIADSRQNCHPRPDRGRKHSV